MKIKLKGFTLVELIVVMAIMSILMVAIMNMFKPIRDTYVDSTKYEAKRTAQNGVVQYITESVRYATDLGIYNDGVSSAQDAVSKFATEYGKSVGILDKTSGSPVTPYTAADQTQLENEIKKYAEVIIIDNKNPHYSKGHWGRLIRRKVNMTSPVPIPADPTPNVGDAMTISSTDTNWRTALGEAYYGENTYNINILINDTDSDGSIDGKDGMINVSVLSTDNGKRDISNIGKENTMTGTNDSSTSKGWGNITRGGVLCRNLVGATNKGVTKQGIFDVSKYSGSSVTMGKKTYIVFLRNDKGYEEKSKVEAVVKTLKDSHATP